MGCRKHGYSSWSDYDGCGVCRDDARRERDRLEREREDAAGVDLKAALADAHRVARIREDAFRNAAEVERLKTENARLRAEVARMRGDLQDLKYQTRSRSR